MKVLILTADSNGAYPVPASKGGAVATLIEYLADENNKKMLCDMEILSYYEPTAYNLSKKYKNISFNWVKIPTFVKVLDRLSFEFVRIARKEEKAVSFKSPFSLLYYIWKARGVIRRTDADKIIIENNIPLAMALKYTKFKGQWFYHLHNVPRIDGKCRDVMKKTTRFLCVSQYVADQICMDDSAIGKIKKEKVRILYNCVDTDKFKILSGKKNEDLKIKYGIKENDKVLIFTGRLTEEKGADVLLEAMTLLPDNIKALIVGSYHYNADVKSEFQDKLYGLAKKLSDRVIFTGFIQHEDLPYLYNLADIAVLPSMWEEPAGLTNLEAMACGIPVITTSSGGIPEYVGKSVILDRDEDLAKNISVEVMRLLQDKEYYYEMKEYSRAHVLTHFSKSKYLDNFFITIQ